MNTDHKRGRPAKKDKPIISSIPNPKRKKIESVDQSDNTVSGHWTKEEDHHLTSAVAHNNGKNWKKIAEELPGRTDV